MKRTLLAIILLVLLPGPWLDPAAAAGSIVGKQAPSFTLRDLDGQEISLADFRGRPVILHFWATWCPACRQEMPILEEIARAHGRVAAVLGVNLGERRKVVAAYVKEQGLTFPILLDARGKAASSYDVTALPATLLLGADGVVVKSIPMGSLDLKEVEGLLRNLAR